MADTADLKSASFGSTGSSPVPGTSFFTYCRKQCRTKIRQLLRKITFSRTVFSFCFLSFFSMQKNGTAHYYRVAFTSHCFVQARRAFALRRVPSRVPFFLHIAVSSAEQKSDSCLGKLHFPALSFLFVLHRFFAMQKTALLTIIGLPCAFSQKSPCGGGRAASPLGLRPWR